MAIETLSSPLREDYPKWLKLLYVFYKYVDYSPLKPRTLWDNPQMRMDIDEIPIKDRWTLNSLIHRIYNFQYLYRFGDIKWQGYTYLINMKGLNALRRHKLLTEEQEQYARRTVLQILERVDPKKYHKVVINMKK